VSEMDSAENVIVWRMGAACTRLVASKDDAKNATDYTLLTHPPSFGQAG
jgi:hypothetical protein